jgi:hypothetical protein
MDMDGELGGLADLADLSRQLERARLDEPNQIFVIGTNGIADAVHDPVIAQVG